MRYGRLSIDRAGDLRRVQSVLLQGKAADILIKVIRCIRKRGKNDDLPIPRIDGVRLLFPDERNERFELGVVLRRDISHHAGEQLEGLRILLKLMQP